MRRIVVLLLVFSSGCFDFGALSSGYQDEGVPEPEDLGGSDLRASKDLTTARPDGAMSDLSRPAEDGPILSTPDLLPRFDLTPQPIDLTSTADLTPSPTSSNDGG
jgi:hypothetical protein